MLKKEEVFVRVSSKKKARKLKELLDMFGEPKDILTFEEFNVFEKPWILNNERTPGVVFYKNEWIGSWFESETGLTQVSIKELRNILAKDKLKDGDVVVCSIGNNEYILKYEGFEDNCFISSTWFTIGISTKPVDGNGGFTNFIRYATEEEKALLNHKKENKELESGKWYIVDKGDCINKNSFDAIIFYKGKDYGYGLNHIGEWTNEYNTNNHYFFKDVKREATPEEVEQALIKEAKRMYKVGDNLSKIFEDYSKGEMVFSDKVGYQDSDSSIWFSDTNGYETCVFKDGKWAEIIKPSNKNEDLERLQDIINEAVTLITKLKNK